MKLRSLTSAVAIAIAASAAAPAMAQDAPAAGPAAQEDQGLAEIVVTAQRREQSLQNVPAPVTAVSGDTLQALNVTQPESLTQLAPALNISQAAGAFSLFYLRGVGSFGGNSLSDSATAFNYDGVYIARTSSTYGMYYDLNRVEVLKGPQGTLYGRNATGGAINIIPNRPRYGETGGEFSIDYGNRDALTLSGAVNLPLGDSAAARISGQWTDRDGYQSDGTSDAKGRGIRAQIGGELADGLSVRVAADYFHSGGRGPGGTVRLANGTYLNGDANIGLEDPRTAAYFASLPVAQRPFIVGASRQDNDFRGVNAEISYKTGIGTFTLIPAYRRADTDFVTNAPGFTINQGETDKQTSVEFRLASNSGGKLQYVAGVYYLDEDIATDGILSSQSAAGARQIYTPQTRSWAVFGQLSYEIVPGFRATGGIRYTEDDKSTAVSQDNDPRGPSPTDFAFAAGRKDNAVTWRGALEYDAGANNLLYASVETGYKAGGFTLSAAAPTYDDETITAYTLGSKNKFLDNRLLLNLEAYWWKYKDQQYSHLGAIVLPGGVTFPAFVTDNVGDATIKGVDVETQFLVTPDTLLGAQVQYLDAGYDSFVYRTPNLAPVPVRPNVGGLCTNSFTAASLPGQPGIQTVDCTGAPLPFTSKWTISLAAQQTFHIGEGKLVASANGRYESGKYAGSEFLPAQYQDGVWTMDASLAYTFAGDRFTLTGYVRNLTDKDVLAQTFVPFSSRAFVVATVRPPRSYGVRLSAKF